MTHATSIRQLLRAWLARLTIAWQRWNAYQADAAEEGVFQRRVDPLSGECPARAGPVGPTRPLGVRWIL
jgi:hypothetical protein